jgi:hypothetical protein
LESVSALLSGCQSVHRAVTVIVVVEQEPMYPAGRLCEIIAWPPGPMVVTVVVKLALFQSCCA